MATTEQVELPLMNASGVCCGTLVISTPPSSREDIRTNLIALHDNDEHELEPVQLLEASEYRYRVNVSAESIVIEPREVIYPDDRSGRTGRLRTGLYTGCLTLSVIANEIVLGQASFEVRSIKLGYLDEYRWMLNDIASVTTELALQRFAASEQRLNTDQAVDSSALYQRFCFLKGIILGDRVESALATILDCPFVAWERSAATVSPGCGVRASSRFAQELTKSGPRLGWPDAWHVALRELPAKLSDTRFVEDTDNIPNRFVRFVLEEWLARIADIAERLQDERARCRADRVPEPAAVARGLREVRAVQDRLEQMLDMPLIRAAGRLTHFPGSNQVLQRRAGYRDIRELYALSEFASTLAWNGAEDIFTAGQRNVAALYEYWVFIQIANIMADITQDSICLCDLIKSHKNGLVLGLKHGCTSTLAGTVERSVARLRVEVSFNREFRRNASGGSWTQTMRPDCSILISAEPDDPLIESVSLHFDAKYRVASLEEILGHGDEDLAASSGDLLKMHAYRDAILKAVGAYVIFPGNKPAMNRKFEEIVPGLGAFPLTPGPNGVSVGREALYTFLSTTLDHVAARGSKRARASFWHTTAYSGEGSERLVARPRWLRRPPADTIALFGYVRSDAHLAWIRDNALYNLRADARTGAVSVDSAALRAEVLFLYGPSLGLEVEIYSIVDTPRVQTAAQLHALGYPGGRGEAYFTLKLASEQPVAGLDVVIVELAIQRFPDLPQGAPFCLSFQSVLALISRRT
jgi:predicted component of viral defense system (DUF524 family)